MEAGPIGVRGQHVHKHAVWLSKLDAGHVVIQNQRMVAEYVLVQIGLSCIAVICHHVQYQNSLQSMVDGDHGVLSVIAVPNVEEVLRLGKCSDWYVLSRV